MDVPLYQCRIHNGVKRCGALVEAADRASHAGEHFAGAVPVGSLLGEEGPYFGRWGWAQKDDPPEARQAPTARPYVFVMGQFWTPGVSEVHDSRTFFLNPAAVQAVALDGSDVTKVYLAGRPEPLILTDGWRPDTLAESLAGVPPDMGGPR